MQEHEHSAHGGRHDEEAGEALDVLRTVWSARGQTSADIDDSCDDVKACKRMSSVGFHGLLGEDAASSASPHTVSSDLRAAWKRTLEREGKLNAKGKSLRQLMQAPSTPER